MFRLFILFLRNFKTLLDLSISTSFLVAQMVRNLSAMQEAQVQSLSWEDPLEKEMAFSFATNHASLSKLRETVKNREAWQAAVHGITKTYTRLSDWTIIFYNKWAKWLLRYIKLVYTYSLLPHPEQVKCSDQGWYFPPQLSKYCIHFYHTHHVAATSS